MTQEPVIIARAGDIVPDESGSAAWEFLEDVHLHEPIRAGQIVRLPSREQPVPGEVVNRDVSRFIKQRLAEHWLKVS